MKMQEGLYSDGSEDSELEVWDESAVAAVETSIRLQKKRDQESVTQWGSNYFRPGTAPEVPSLAAAVTLMLTKFRSKEWSQTHPQTTLSRKRQL